MATHPKAKILLTNALPRQDFPKRPRDGDPGATQAPGRAKWIEMEQGAGGTGPARRRAGR
jgi:hypothetical protein